MRRHPGSAELKGKPSTPQRRVSLNEGMQRVHTKPTHFSSTMMCTPPCLGAVGITKINKQANCKVIFVKELMCLSHVSLVASTLLFTAELKDHQDYHHSQNDHQRHDNDKPDYRSHHYAHNGTYRDTIPWRGALKKKRENCKVLLQHNYFDLTCSNNGRCGGKETAAGQGCASRPIRSTQRGARSNPPGTTVTLRRGLGPRHNPCEARAAVRDLKTEGAVGTCAFQGGSVAKSTGTTPCHGRSPWIYINRRHHCAYVILYSKGAHMIL